MRKNIIKILFFIVLGIYALITLINQQITLDRYSENKEKLSEQIQEEKTHNEELIATKDNVNSTEFIEQMAREKLSMYLPTEKVYVDTGM